MCSGLGQRRWVAEASLTGGLIASWSGDPSEAERRIRSAYDAFRSRGEVLDAALVAGELAFVLTDLGGGTMRARSWIRSGARCPTTPWNRRSRGSE